MLAALAVSSSALATEYRTPYLSERGPLRHSFKKLHKKKMNLNTWSTIYTKEAHKAFLKHGTNTKELTAVLFNKETFAFRDIFPNAEVPLNSPNYNPFLRTLSYSPKAKYFDWGANFGGQIDFPVWKEDDGCVKGRIGLRANIPFRTIEVEREDFAPVTASVEENLSEVVRSGVIRVDKDNDGNTVGAAATSDVLATAYRLDFVQSIPDAVGASIVRITAPTDAGNDGMVKIFGQNITQNFDAGDPAVIAAATVGVAAGTGIFTPQVFAWKRDITGAETNPATSDFANAQITAIATDLKTTEGQIKVFANTVDYSAIDFNSDAIEAAAADAWLVFQRGSNADNDRRLTGVNAQTIDRMLQDRLRAFNIDALNYLANNGFVFDSYKKSGLGDIDVDLFYEHMFSKCMIAELFLGVRFPSGTTKNSCNNPYRAIAKLGNGEHFEIKLGANFAWDACKWFSLKLDAYYSFVLESKEQRAAVFAGSTAKNIGPCVDADVDWGYFVGRLDFQFVHPKTCRLSTLMGYEFYYKTEDHLTFKNSTATSWLGTVAALDSKLARKNTESISHKARMESTWKPNKWLELFIGGAVTFAGQNVFRDMDAHGGFNVRY